MTTPDAVRDNPERQRFEMPVEGGLAFANYRRTGDVLLITHTEVPQPLEGRGLGSALVRGLFDLARAQGLKVRPLCPFVVAYMNRHPEVADLRG